MLNIIRFIDNKMASKLKTKWYLSDFFRKMFHGLLKRLKIKKAVTAQNTYYSTVECYTPISRLDLY